MDRLDADRMFVQVVRLGSFSAAAKNLGTSPGQASKLVSKLEEHLRIRLLNRTTRAVTLTVDGERYFTRIAAILDQMDDLDDDLRSAGQMPGGLLRMTAPLTFGTMQLLPALADFAKIYPGIGLDVQFTDSVMSLAEHGYDAAIRVGNLRDSSLRATRLGRTHVQMVASRDYLARRGPPRQPADLRQHDIICDSNFPQPDQWAFFENDETTMITVNSRLHFANAEACIIAAANGLGITRVPDFVSAAAVKSGRLVAVLPEYQREGFDIHVLTPAGRHMPSRLRLLIDFLRKRWANGPNWAD
ncbi:LysR family transcriptional regulator [Paracoccus caeni]|uniref:LysR family transcriptional regulator n=1 Tax=Paracoccus caeni TaxID=657651 RepID=A0A934S9S3_9RHOB|nr:LysR family transcriptional regulator [Paracoccus caeni]MBK4214776.1 LysR family transcriptional regulator [Paracoccus caeni]